ncbi:MAG TPA: large-conductance mechanosensitive channel protein MscL [Candidatus Limiplasma sp.]|nr:large-conductance mechanosensitive channel protein MscL [Candidatus Limiplasma sp.]
MLKEFKQFAIKGNVMDLAVAVIIGAAFGKIVTSLVNDVIMPVIGLIIGGIDFAALKIILTPAVGDTAEVAILYGTFIQTVVDFLLIALSVFFVVKLLSKLKKKEETKPEAPAEPPKDIVLLTEIRDLLKAK